MRIKQTAAVNGPGRAARGAGRLVVLLTAIALLGLTGCGDDSGDDPDPVDIGGSAEAGGDEEQLEQLAADYGSALTKLKKTKAADGSFDGVLTPELEKKYLANYRKNIFDKGKTIAGQWRMNVEDIEVKGDTADLDVCADGREAYVVDAKDPRIGEDSVPFGESPTTFTATRTGDGWLISDDKERKGSCN